MKRDSKLCGITIRTVLIRINLTLKQPIRIMYGALFKDKTTDILIIYIQN
jgi:hypothetical protein